MKIPIETKEEKDQPEENEAWMEKLHHNAAIMSACMDAFPDKPECVRVALFKSIVPSASQGDIGKLLKMGFDVLGKADKSMDDLITFDNAGAPDRPGHYIPPPFFATGGLRSMSGPPPSIPKPPTASDVCHLCGSGSLLQTVFLTDGENGYRDEAYICMKCLRRLVLADQESAKESIEPPEPPPPGVPLDYIIVSTTATLLYENQKHFPIKIRVFNDDPQLGLEIGTQDVKPCKGRFVSQKGHQDVILPASVTLWGVAVSGGVKVRVRIIDSLEEKDIKGISAAMRADRGIPIFCETGSTSDDRPVCWLCGSSDLTQAIYLPEGSEREKHFVCLKCVRNLVTDYRESLKELVPDSDSIPDEKPVCCLCGSGHLLQTVYLHGSVTEHSDSYIIPSTGQIVSLRDSFICMECLRKLIERERRNVG